MKKVNQLIYFLFFFYSLNIYSQKKYLDYIITQKNDTIFGTFRNDIIGKVLYEKNPKFKKGGIKYYSHKLKKNKLVRFNDDIYIFKKSNDDGIYENENDNIYNDTSNVITLLNTNFFNIKPRLIDYVVTINNDTIYGVIKDPTFSKDYLIDKNNIKIKIEKESIKEYRHINDIYQYFEKEKVSIFDSKKAFLKLLLNGKVKLYQYEYHFIEINPNQNNQTVRRVKYYYYILKDNELILLRNLGYKKTLNDLFSDMKQLISKINDDEYTLENIYLIVKYYNEEK